MELILYHWSAHDSCLYVALFFSSLNSFETEKTSQ